MAVKSIKLRGITRNPSDRMMEEGGVAESLNVYLDNTENRPMAYPKRYYNERYLPTLENYDVIFIDEGRYICKKGNDIGTWDYTFNSFCTLDQGEIVTDVSSVGNTLIINTNKGIRYALYKDGAYNKLGAEIPTPDIKFYGQDADMLSETEYESQCETPGFVAFTTGKKNNNKTTTFLNPFGSEMFQYLDGIVLTDRGEKKGVFTLDDTTFLTGYATGTGWSGSNYRVLDNAGVTMLENLWNGINSLRDYNHYFGILNAPVFLSFAVRLYDGSFYRPSSPIALGMYNGNPDRHPNWFYTTVNTYMYKNEKFIATAVTDFDYAYKAHVLFGDIKNQFEGWRDLVEGIDIYITSPVRFEKDATKCKVISHQEKSTSLENQKKFEIKMVLDPDTMDGHIEDSLVKDMVFHKIYSYKFDEFSKISNTDLRIDEDLRTDSLSVKETMTGSYSTNHSIYSTGSMDYNNRLCLFDATRTMTKGYPHLNGGHKCYSNSIEYRFIWEIMSVNGKTMCVYSDIIDTRLSDNEFDRAYGIEPYSFISYPDSRCKSVIIGKKTTQWEYKRIPMNEIPMADCAYSFAGLNTSIFDHPDAIDVEADKLPQVIDTEIMRGYLFQSEPSNPFVFNDEGILKICDSEVLDVATITTALSEGQFGSFGLYVFSKQGIWVLGINDEGGIINSLPLSRDVAISKDMIMPIDQAIVFLTKKGLKLLTSSQVEDLSTFMNGPQWKLSNTNEKTILNEKGFGEFKNTLEDDKWLMTFLEGAKGAYDYAGGRLIFINPEYHFQYVYMLASQSWHKIHIPGAGQYKFSSPVNSYPNCQTSVHKEYLSGIRVTQCVPEEVNINVLKETLDEFDLDYMDDYAPFLRGEVCLDIIGKTEEFAEEVIESLGHIDIRSKKEYSMDSGLFEWSTCLTGPDVDDGEIKGVIVTRPISLDNDDILKTISAIKVRGHYSRYDADGKPRVMYILEGSQDGINFHRLGSLRGKAWKMYRVIVMFKLTRIESLSWIDIEYDTKFTDRLR